MSKYEKDKKVEKWLYENIEDDTKLVLVPRYKGKEWSLVRADNSFIPYPLDIKLSKRRLEFIFNNTYGRYPNFCIVRGVRITHQWNDATTQAMQDSLYLGEEIAEQVAKNVKRMNKAHKKAKRPVTKIPKTVKRYFDCIEHKDKVSLLNKVIASIKADKEDPHDTGLWGLKGVRGHEDTFVEPLLDYLNKHNIPHSIEKEK